MMDVQTWQQSLNEQNMPKGLSREQQAIWYACNGDWNKAHELVQVLNTPQANRIHAFLHRQEGDDWNADYWYQRAGTTRPNLSIDDELEQLVANLVLN